MRWTALDDEQGMSAIEAAVAAVKTLNNSGSSKEAQAAEKITHAPQQKED